MSNLVLYRKYRPKTFGQVVNQEHIKKTLANAVINSRVGHAYLFVGPRGVGKTTLARIFARAVNCPNKKGAEPCNNCEICTPFFNGTSLDLLEIDAASHTGVDNIRELIEHLQFAPSQAAYKVIIVDEVHMLSKGAFNALLKSLEEPPAHAIFILATTEINKVPATIISRTQRFDFKKVSIADLNKLLKFVCDDNKAAITPEALLMVAAAADGSFRDGLSLLDQVINFVGGDITEQLVEEVLGLTGISTTSEFLGLLMSGSGKDALDFIANLAFSGKDLYQFERDFLEYLRKVLLVKVGAKAEFGFSAEILARLQAQASNLDLPRLMKIIGIFQKAENEMKWTTIQSLPLEVAAVEASSLTTSASNHTISTEAKRSREIPEQSDLSTRPVEAGHAGSGSENLNLILSHWPQILDKIKDYNHSLISSLKLSVPAAVEGNELILNFPYKFHKDAIDARKNRIIVDQVIEDVTGLKLMVKPTLAKENGEIKNSPMEAAMKIMGGEIE